MKWALYNLTTTTKSGGVETSAWSLAAALHRRGHEVEVIGGRSDRPLPPIGREIKVHTHPFRPRQEQPNLGTRARRFLERMSMAKTAVPELKKGGYDRVVVFKPYDMLPAVWVKRSLESRIRIGYLSGGTEFFPGYAFLGRRMDYLGAVSEFNARQIREATGLDFRVNYLGVDKGVFRPSAPDLELRERAGIEEGDEVLVSAVRLVALKGIHRAMEAMALLLPSRPRLRLVVAGEGSYRPKLEERAIELGIADRVCLLGFLEPSRLAGFYALGRLAVFPSLGEESLGLSAAEALACGLPVVASQLGGLPEVVGEGGILVPPRDVEGLAQAVARILDYPDLAQRMAQSGRERVGRVFDWDASAARLEEGMS